MAVDKIITIYTANRGFKKCIDTRKNKIKPADGFKDILAVTMKGDKNVSNLQTRQKLC